jgi:hypothetical protein
MIRKLGEDVVEVMFVFLMAFTAVLTFTCLTFLREQANKPIVISLDLTQGAMRACAEAFVRYGFWDVKEHECRVEKGAKGMVVALYGPGADGKSGEKKRLGEVPLER